MWNGVPITLPVFMECWARICRVNGSTTCAFSIFCFFFLEVRIFTHIRVIVTPKWVMNCDMKMGYIEVKNL
jgi:hypothetical protein